LVKNPDADKNWTAVVMKKKRCNPWDIGCGDGRFHLNIAVPGFDNHEFDSQNVCGKPGTSLSKHQSALCGGAAPRDCDCSGLPEHNDAQKRMKAGCELFHLVLLTRFSLVLHLGRRAHSQSLTSSAQ